MPRYRRVTLQGRCEINALLKIKASKASIARSLGIHKSTVSRELKRNSEGKLYLPMRAEKLARERFMRCRRQRKLQGELEKLVIGKVIEGWSPHQVVGRMKLEKCEKKVSHQTIYRYARRQRCADLAFYASLRRKRKPRGNGRMHRRKNRPSWMNSIRDRPEIINHRKRVGDWERDTMFGAGIIDRVLVCVERKTRYIKMVKVKNPYPDNITEQTKKLLEPIKKKVLSMTNDNGNEFMDGDAYGVPVYYADPHSPHQRGSVENIIGLVRQYLPKGKALDRVTDAEIQALEDRLNMRPRKCLDYKTPYEMFFETAVALAV